MFGSYKHCQSQWEVLRKVAAPARRKYLHVWRRKTENWGRWWKWNFRDRHIEKSQEAILRSCISLALFNIYRKSGWWSLRLEQEQTRATWTQNPVAESARVTLTTWPSLTVEILFSGRLFTLTPGATALSSLVPVTTPTSCKHSSPRMEALEATTTSPAVVRLAMKVKNSVFLRTIHVTHALWCLNSSQLRGQFISVLTWWFKSKPSPQQLLQTVAVLARTEVFALTESASADLNTQALTASTKRKSAPPLDGTSLASWSCSESSEECSSSAGKCTRTPRTSPASTNSNKSILSVKMIT